MFDSIENKQKACQYCVKIEIKQSCIKGHIDDRFATMG